MSRTGTLGRLFGHVPEPVVEMHPQDIARQRLAEGDLVRITSRRGSVVLPVQASAQVALSQTFVAMHWGEEVLSGSDAEGRPMLGINATDAAGLLPALEAARTEALGGEDRPGRTAVAAAGARLAAR